MTTWTYGVDLNTDLATIELHPAGGAPLQSGYVIPVASGTNPTIVLQGNTSTFVFHSIDFWLDGNENSIIRIQESNPPSPLPRTLYNFTSGDLIFDLKLLSLSQSEISFSNSNGILRDYPALFLTINFQIVLRAGNVIYVSKDPQLEDERDT